MQNVILHLDMDCFFASVEQQCNPNLAGKPIGVIKGEGRTCIIAASREAKKIGIKTGISTYDAKKIFPRIVLVPADFDKYFSVTKRFIEICSRFSPDLEVFSIDELFLDVTHTAEFFSGDKFDKKAGGPPATQAELAKALRAGVLGIVSGIKNAIREEIGEHITCSIGISYNRLLAKLASGIKKPNGVFEITTDNRDQVLFSCKLTDLCGLGCRLEKRLLNAGITNFKTLREMPMEFLETSFGPFWSKELKRLSYGEDDSLLTRVGEIPKMKSVSRTFTLYKNTTELKIIKGTLRNLCEEAAFKAREMKMKGREVGIAIRGEVNGIKNWGGYEHKTLRYFIDDGGEIFRVIWPLFNKMNWKGSVRFLGVWLGMLSPDRQLTGSIFPEERKRSDLIAAMDKVNRRFGELSLYPAVLLEGEMIKSEVNGFLGDKGFRLG
jgi:DNA polymerase-4